jgi:putative membrane protein
MNDHQTADAGTPSPAEAAASQASVRDHLANERTLLAWVRTALTIIGLGFILGRLLVEDGAEDVFLTASSVALVLLGGIASLLAARRFLRTEREIETGDFHPSSQLDVALAGGVAVAALVLAASLVLGR